MSDEIADPMLGRRVRDFEIRERIGRGGMGAVYKAEHLLLHEPRALKVIRAELFRAVPQALERFEREARIAVRLRHPNLVLIHDFFVESGDHFLVMEYVVGQSLSELLRTRGALPVDELCRIGAQCCAGLAHAHELGIVHRDLSPENVMLTPTASGPAVKIIDFGVARAAFGGEETQRMRDATLTRAGDFVGKPRYASPEQAGSLRPGEDLDARSDVYSLGLVLYEMATGSLPFHSESAVGFLALQLYQAPTAPSQLRPELEIPPALERVILRCLEKDRARRFANVRELGLALEEVARQEAERTARARRRRSSAPARLAAAAAGVVVLGAAAAWWRQASLPTLESVSSEPAAAAPAAPPAPQPVPAPVEPEPVARAPELTAAPTPAPTAAPAPLAEAEAKPAAPPAPPAPHEAPPTHSARRAEPAPAASFANAGEMQSAFDAAVAYEASHRPAEAVENWKRFRRRSPSHELDESAKRHITDLTLGGMQSFP
ncbi:MAG TPA: serine/threonine-protein kinase [Myxococcota bacterium]|nr:serine/threonine-protein kinase [Myxococcota bacterium]